MAIELNQALIDPDIKEIPPARNRQTELQGVLKGLQGTILKSRGRKHSRHLFIYFFVPSLSALRAFGTAGEN